MFELGVDKDRARNEIALIDLRTNEVKYGLDAMASILVKRWVWIGWLLKNKAVHIFLEYLYKFISQNRKVIAPSVLETDDCRPEGILRYRVLYILLVAVFSSLVIYNFTKSINSYFDWESTYFRELLICFGQFAWQALLFHKYLKSKTWEYLGNMSTVSLIGTFLLFPAFLFGNANPLILAGWFSLVVAFMIWEHYRRCKLLSINMKVTLGWVLYRAVVLGFIITLNY